MNLYIAKLSILACGVIGARALHVPILPSSVTDICPSAQVVDWSTIVSNGYEILLQEFTCPDGKFSLETISDATWLSSHPRLSSLEARSQAECTTSASICQCGTAVDCTCFSNGIAPSTSDCNTLIGSTAVISTIQGPTFMTQPNNFHSISLNTCTIGFLNLADFAEEFCWDDLAAQGNRVVGCFPELTSGFCLSNNQRYLTRLGHSN